MSIYQSAGDDWIFFDGATKHRFDTEQEAQLFMAKLDTAKAIVRTVQSLAQATDSAGDLEAEYFDVGNWTDEDVSAIGITAAQLSACLTLLQQIDLLMTGQATTPSMYRTTLNQVRRVSA